MDKGYWKRYYKRRSGTHEPSLFARFALKNHVRKGESLIELGHGNGRDSAFFASNGVKVTAVDQVETELNELAKSGKLPNLTVISGDFTKLGALGPFDKVYSRFTLHSISDMEEGNVIVWSHANLKDRGHALIEARGRKNELYGLGTPVEGEPHAYIHEDHYRRFIHLDALVKKLSDAGFTVISAEEMPGFAPFEDTDQIFIRVVAAKGER